MDFNIVMTIMSIGGVFIKIVCIVNYFVNTTPHMVLGGSFIPRKIAFLKSSIMSTLYIQRGFILLSKLVHITYSNNG